MRCGNLGGNLRLAVRGRSQRRSTEQRRLARHPIPELPFDDRPVVRAEHRHQQRTGRGRVLAAPDVKPPPARRSGSVAGVTGACVCDGWGLNWLRVG